LLVEAGYPPEAVLLELYLSGEFAYSFEKMREVGGLEQMKYHSHTSQYGSATRSQRFRPLADPIKQRMGEVLSEIQNGTFAEEWSRNQAQAAQLFEKIRHARANSDMNRWEESARRAFRIGNAARA
jgi:ketol-acid reductoisomerase